MSIVTSLKGWIMGDAPLPSIPFPEAGGHIFPGTVGMDQLILYVFGGFLKYGLGSPLVSPSYDPQIGFSLINIIKDSFCGNYPLGLWLRKPHWTIIRRMREVKHCVAWRSHLRSQIREFQAWLARLVGAGGCDLLVMWPCENEILITRV